VGAMLSVAAKQLHGYKEKKQQIRNAIRVMVRSMENILSEENLDK
jgi:hypothetical protein